MSLRRARRALIATAAISLFGLTLSACASGDAGNGSASGGEVVWAIEGANLSDSHMDPHTSQLDVSSMVQRQILDSLVWQNADGSFSPWLAKEWTVSDDGLTYTFTLRDDVTFHDGEKFTAESVEANFEHIVDPETNSAQAASMLGGEWYAGTKVIDEYTVEVSFTQPYAPFLSAASTPLLGFYSTKALEAGTEKLKAGAPDVNIGTGPFVLTEFIPNQEIVYSRNDDYAWGPQGQNAPNIETLRVALVLESSVRTGMLNSGEAQIASDLPPSAVANLADTVTVESKPVPGLPYSLYLNEKYGVLADQQVREAISIGIDIDTAVDTIFDGQFERAWSILSPSSPGYDASLENTWAFDPEAAAALLDDAGWATMDADGYRTKDGKRLSVRWIAWTPIADENKALAVAFQADLKKIGVELIRGELEPAAYNEQYGPKTFDITDWGFSGPDSDLLRNHLHTDGFQNASQVSDPALDALFEQAIATSDTDERNDVYTQVQQWNAADNAIIPIYVPALISATDPSISGLAFDVYGRPLFYDVTLN
ncbi:ABC transporter substrate-binding protein [Microbacterium sp. NC79]|uniref:ABC transporter substrate-binding protein n=1 Tax=Microbacterium sp. NC79 TaxID=2851009 RepID=UPI001C2C69A4|nr:ABC transporter substrate-binding protein [Microbacterium sp. NC79]MBV0894767.1 ABC transporter substrate-binding protein [Microbacterium sp. NC79]